MSEFVNLRTALGKIEDLTTPTAAQKYQLGIEVETIDEDTKAVNKYIYVKAHAGLTQYQPYIVSLGSTSGAEVITAAPATLVTIGSLVCVPQVAFTTAYYGFVQIQGTASCLLTAETYAVGDHLQLLNTGAAMVVDGTSGSTVVLVSTCAISKAAGTTAVAQSVYLWGKPSAIAAT